jgi:hypothetical protein
MPIILATGLALLSSNRRVEFGPHSKDFLNEAQSTETGCWIPET